MCFSIFNLGVYVFLFDFLFATSIIQEKTVVDLFQETAKNNAEAIALEFEDTKVTYAELAEKSNQFAIQLPSFISIDLQKHLHTYHKIYCNKIIMYACLPIINAQKILILKFFRSKFLKMFLLEIRFYQLMLYYYRYMIKILHEFAE
mgnify:CR=1 FL=1